MPPPVCYIICNLGNNISVFEKRKIHSNTILRVCRFVCSRDCLFEVVLIILSIAEVCNICLKLSTGCYCHILRNIEIQCRISLVQSCANRCNRISLKLSHTTQVRFAQFMKSLEVKNISVYV